MFRNAFFSSTALAVSLVLSASAYAADPVVTDPVPFAQPDADRFCGPYAGIQAGYTWGDTEWSGLDTTYIGSGNSYLDAGKHDGISGGLYAGCNFTHNSWLAGVEADVNLLGAGYDNSWYSTVRIRGGKTFGDTLVYATGGLAFGQVDLISQANDQIKNGLSMGMYYLDKPVAVGWAAGLGVEHWFGEKVSWKTEYLYMDLGEVTSYGIQAGQTRIENLSADYKSHTVRTGIAIHF